MTTTVYHEEWHIGDSRQPFRIGNHVTWLVVPHGGRPVAGSGTCVSVTRATAIDPMALDLDERIAIGYVAVVDLLEPIDDSRQLLIEMDVR